MVGIGVPQDSSGRDESEAPLGSSSSHATHESQEISGEDQSEAPGGSSSPRTPPDSGKVEDASGGDESRTLAPGSSSPRTPPRPGDVKDSSGGDESKAPAPGSSSPRPPIRTTNSKESSGSDQSRVPTPGSSSPSPRTSISSQLPLFGLVVGPDKSSSPSGRGRLINPKFGGTAAPNESQGTDKSKSERSRTSRGVPIVESSLNILQSNDQQSHASPAANRSIVPPEEGSKEDSVVESTSNTPQTTEQSDASPFANNTTAPPARDSPEVASVADSTSKAQQTTEISFAKSRAEYMTGSASKSRQMTEKYQVPPVASIHAGLAKSKPGRSRYRDRTSLLADTSVYLPPAYNIQVQMPPRGIYTSKSPEQDAGASQSSSGLDEPKAPPSSPRSEELPASPAIDNPKAPSLTTDKGKVPKATDQYARKWGSKLGSQVTDQSEAISAPSTAMKSNRPGDITEYGLIVGPDPNCAPTGKGRYIRPVVRPTAGPNECQGTDKSKSKDTDKSKFEKSGGATDESKSQDTEESKSESAFLDGLMGKEDNLAGVPVYISGSTDKPSAIILMSDIYGFTPQLFRKVADKVAAAGYLAVIPDYFNGDPYKMVEGENPMSAFPDWLAKHPAATVENLELTKKLIEFMKDNYGTTYVGLAGFGYGAKIAVTVGKDHDAKAIVQLNPLFVEASDYEEVAVPIAVVAAPEDGVGKHMEILKSRSKKVKMVVNIYSGAVPGWPVRYDEKDARAVRKANTAHKVMLNWFRDNM